MLEYWSLDIRKNYDDEGLYGAKYRWYSVIDDEALESLGKAPEPIGLTSPEGVRPLLLADNAYHAFAKLLFMAGSSSRL
jgi:hypothetical protein